MAVNTNGYVLQKVTAEIQMSNGETTTPLALSLVSVVSLFRLFHSVRADSFVTICGTQLQNNPRYFFVDKPKKMKDKEAELAP